MREEAPSWSWGSKGSGEILDEEWSLISCHVFSKLIRHYRRTFQKVFEFQKVLNKRVPLIVANVYLRKIYFNIINDISPHFKILLSNERLHFVNF